MTTASKRKDKRGHWPAGKRRNPDAVNWSRTRLALQRLLDRHAEPSVISRRELARVLQVDMRSVGRWLDGTDRPAEAMQLAVAQWVSEHAKGK